jgi:hypothetical protein
LTRFATFATLAMAVSAAAQPVLSYSTFLGGNGNDTAYGLATFADGTVFIAGDTTSSDFPSVNPIQSGGGGFVARFNAATGAFVYATPVGTGSATVYIAAVTVDKAGNAFLACSTSDPNMPTVNAIQPVHGGNYDAFVIELSPTGTLLFATYLGGPSSEYAHAIAVDSAGLIYIAGETDGPGLPTHFAIQPSALGSNDMFAAKIDPINKRVVFATYLGGASDDRGFALALDGDGGVYVGGTSFSTDYPLSGGALGAMGNYDGVLTRLSSDGGLIFSTHTGGSDYDLLNALTPRPGGGVIAAGDTASTDMLAPNAVQPLNGGGHDAFVLGFDALGTLQFATYLGGSTDESAYGVAVGPAGDIFVCGSTTSADFPKVQPIQNTLHTDGGPANAFVARLGVDGAGLFFTTFLGGGGAFVTNPFATYFSLAESANAVAVDSAGGLWVAGQTSAPAFPTVGAWQGKLDGGGGDAFLLKISFAVDGGTTDGGAPDAGTVDAGPIDAGLADAGIPDSGSPDAGLPDAGAPDAGGSDSGTPDSGESDAGMSQFRSVGCGCQAAQGPWALFVLVLALRKRHAYPFVLKRSRAGTNQLSARRLADARESAGLGGRRPGLVPRA